MHQVSFISNHYSQKNNIEFDFCIRMRTDIMIENPINLSRLNKNVITIKDCHFNGPYGGNLALDHTVAIGNKELMKKYNDLFIYLPAYYFIFKVDWVPEFIIGLHLRYQKIPFEIFPTKYHIIRYSDDEYNIKT